ncbi:major facilitator superfamily domain-containing protein 10 [Parasteatoda tepidariorum]|uniref:major facilitator superfamily domain-containing protein 10 n=1 Tax=Parasteatoda tepidariorum TaxID=114398 RepID=UPI001C717DE0|nr:major facilitator superfamily domain-containing protein 10 [Parasteatoda tepidariorum]XP_042905318.1 major facilitator superfamily domain-containing protein 10 [Parasteatoda tepidariorum]XP_042905319.1 major facilitator superfamily domain-containing protein 10 [Parasteatoda tepidariorum]XP_042905320.1 major facilitator superfamily domain-containing protein 10 [Parasteatoda tepidariorum]
MKPDNKNKDGYSELDNEIKIESETKNSSSLHIIFIVLVIDLLGFTVILPLLPSIFDYYAANKQDYLYHWMEEKVQYVQNMLGSPTSFNKVLFAGLLGSAFSGLQFLVAPIFGSLSDVYGRKPIIILSMIGVGISHAVWCVSNSFYIFIIARIIGGLSRANISLSTAIVTDVCSKQKRGRGMALIGIAFAIGFIIGPMIGAVFATRAVQSKQVFFVAPAVFALVMTVIDIVILIFKFKESLPIEKRASSVGHSLSEAYRFIYPPSLFLFSPVVDIKKEEKSALKQIGLIYFLFLFIYSGLEYSLSFLTHMRFNFTSMQQGKMFLFSGLIMIVIQGGYVRRIPHGKETRAAAIGCLLVIPSFIIIGNAKSVEVLYFGLALYAYASATVVPCLTTIASKFGSSKQKGIVLGIFRSLGSLARAFGPIVSAIAYWSFSPEVSYTIGGVLLVVPLILIMKFRYELPQKEE